MFIWQHLHCAFHSLETLPCDMHMNRDMLHMPITGFGNRPTVRARDDRAKLIRTRVRDQLS